MERGRLGRFSSTLSLRLRVSHSFVLLWPQLKPQILPFTSHWFFTPSKDGDQAAQPPTGIPHPYPNPCPRRRPRQGPYLPSPSLPSTAHPDLGLVSRAQL